jgi:hypothetical protein
MRLYLVQNLDGEVGDDKCGLRLAQTNAVAVLNDVSHLC